MYNIYTYMYIYIEREGERERERERERDYDKCTQLYNYLCERTCLAAICVIA